MTNSIFVVCEDLPDFRLATEIADRVFQEAHGFDTPLEQIRTYRGLPEEQLFLRWASIKKLAQNERITPLGHFGGVPGEADAQAARLA